MQLAKETPHSRIIILRLLLIGLIATAIYALQVLNSTAQIYTGINQAIASQKSIEKTVRLGKQDLAVPTYELFHEGGVWALVSRERPLTGEAGYELVDIPVGHGDEGSTMKIARIMSNELQRLVNAAEADGEPLMVSSAYRSLAEQKDIYDEFVEQNGEAMAAIYVLPVGASEHHTGLSVDFSSVSDECAADSDSCSLSQSAAAWLAKNAYKHGFIQRYPDGGQAITGVGYEPWHYRFVGIPMARALQDSGLTYDEAVKTIAPGYAKSLR